MRKLGNNFLTLGFVCFFLAALLLVRNIRLNYNAGAASGKVMPELVGVIEKNHTDLSLTKDGDNQKAFNVPDPYDTEMDVQYIGDKEYIGFVSIPDLKLELPVISSWSYKNLNVAPCRYTGSSKTDDLTIAAHNYKNHFGNINTLELGDEIDFTDVNGIVSYYEVVAVDLLGSTEIENMTSGDYDLTLFTCTYDGKSRVTVRCDRTEKLEGSL